MWIRSPLARWVRIPTPRSRSYSHSCKPGTIPRATRVSWSTGLPRFRDRAGKSRLWTTRWAHCFRAAYDAKPMRVQLVQGEGSVPGSGWAAAAARMSGGTSQRACASTSRKLSIFAFTETRLLPREAVMASSQKPLTTVLTAMDGTFSRGVLSIPSRGRPGSRGLPQHARRGASQIGKHLTGGHGPDEGDRGRTACCPGPDLDTHQVGRS